MHINQVFKHTKILAFCVPLAITDLGFVYLNDNGMFNVTINWKNSNCKDKTITIKQLKSLFQQHASCFKTQVDVFESKRLEMLDQLAQYDDETIIEF